MDVIEKIMSAGITAVRRTPLRKIADALVENYMREDAKVPVYEEQINQLFSAWGELNANVVQYVPNEYEASRNVPTRYDALENLMVGARLARTMKLEEAAQSLYKKAIESERCDGRIGLSVNLAFELGAPEIIMAECDNYIETIFGDILGEQGLQPHMPKVYSVFSRTLPKSIGRTAKDDPKVKQELDSAAVRFYLKNGYYKEAMDYAEKRGLSKAVPIIEKIDKFLNPHMNYVEEQN